MSRVFAYCRVSRDDLTTENQMMEMAAAGFAIESHRVIEETISGSSAAVQRDGFNRLLDRMERGDVLVVSKLDRLGRNVVDVVTTIEKLASLGVKVHCLQLGGADLTSAAGRLTMNVLAAVAQFERDLLIERTNSGLRRARAQGKRFGRPPVLSDTDKAAVRAGLANGISISQLAREFDTTRTTIQRARAP